MKSDYYSPKGRYLWDPWLVKHKNYYHAFYLQSPRNCPYKKRHDNKVSIGHAVSSDLINWKTLPTALTPGKKGEWDDFTLWTGAILKKDKKVYMFYTGRNSKSKHIQKIGLATSTDLINWKKHPNNPLIRADKRYYETSSYKNKLGKAGTWRDPSVIQDSKTKDYFMVLSARSGDKRKEYDGCIALAESTNLLNWKVMPPVLYPKVYDEMENPQIIHHKNKYYLFFSVPYKKSFSRTWAKKHGRPIGLHCYYSSTFRGNYRPVNKNGVVLSNGKEIYAIKLLKQKGDIFTAMGWLRKKDGKYLAKLACPFELKIQDDKVTKL
ncbi:MAG: glycoside hydrolase family 68 protein [Nanoarchaeota archaeon]|nr:glycoside hydrolase family 68 protein [Nanoarchaeota archaeon]MBU0977043.1 glycoside hydrolase family 68 protein [Nanoarchaeota archaeon]